MALSSAETMHSAQLPSSTGEVSPPPHTHTSAYFFTKSAATKTFIPDFQEMRKSENPSTFIGNKLQFNMREANLMKCCFLESDTVCALLASILWTNSDSWFDVLSCMCKRWWHSFTTPLHAKKIQPAHFVWKKKNLVSASKTNHLSIMVTFPPNGVALIFIHLIGPDLHLILSLVSTFFTIFSILSFETSSMRCQLSSFPCCGSRSAKSCSFLRR